MAINQLDNSGAVVDPNAGYNYALQQALVKRQRDMAQEQANTQMPDGKMVSGWYVAPHASQYLAAGLQKMLGAYGLSKADQAEKDNAIQSQQQTTQLANALANLKGAQTGVQYDPTQPEQVGPPQTAADGSQQYGAGGKAENTYAAPTFNDKLPIYQQLQQSGPFGQFVAQHGIERDLAGPTFQKLGEGETLFQFDKSGNKIGQLAGAPKYRELDHKIYAIAQAHPELSRAAATDIASGLVTMDDNTGVLYNKATGQPMNYGGAAQPAQAQSTNPQSAISIPDRGTSFAGPQAATNFPKSQAVNPMQAARQNEQVQKQQKIDTELAPKISSAKNDLTGLQAGLDQANQMEKLLSEKTGRNTALSARTGPVQGHLFALTTGNQEFDRLSKNMVLAAAGGKLGAGISNADVSFLDAANASALKPTEVNLNAVRDLKVKLQKQIDAKAAEVNTLTGAPQAAPQAAESKSSSFNW